MYITHLAVKHDTFSKQKQKGCDLVPALLVRA